MHPNPEFQSEYHSGAHKILAGRGDETLLETVAKLNELNPNLDLSATPTLDELANALRVNEERRSGINDHPDLTE